MKIQNINNDFTPEELRQYYADNTTPQSLADAYAFADRNCWCIAHDIDDYEIGTQEYEHIKSVYDEWATLMLEYEEKYLLSCVMKDSKFLRPVKLQCLNRS